MMGATTGISWTDSTWNPIRGCSRVSAGCVNCYAEKVAARFGGTDPRTGKQMPYAGLTDRHGRWNGRVSLVEEHLTDPLRWKKPRRIFVNSMSDLFHENVRNEWIDRIFGIMAAAKQHTFQILTKRPERMKEYLTRHDIGLLWMSYAGISSVDDENHEKALDWTHDGLPNVWLGVSVENQATADERLPLLLETPAAVRFVSYEPALGPVDFGKYLPEIGHAVRCLACGRTKAPVGRSVPDEIANGMCDRDCEGYDKEPFANSLWPGESRKEFGYPRESAERPNLDWVIIGGESGPNARPFDIEWARSTVRQCKAAGVSVFVKQMGANAFTVNETMEWRMEHHPNCSGGSECARLCPVPVPERGFEQEPLRFKDRAGADPSEWPEDLRMQEFPGLEVRT